MQVLSNFVHIFFFYLHLLAEIYKEKEKKENKVRSYLSEMITLTDYCACGPSECRNT